jgi:YD repeat-containing protein
MEPNTSSPRLLTKGAGRVATAADQNGTYTFTYDALCRVSHVDEPKSFSMTFVYDAQGHRTGVIDSLGGATLPPVRSRYASRPRRVRIIAVREGCSTGEPELDAEGRPAFGADHQ